MEFNIFLKKGPQKCFFLEQESLRTTGPQLWNLNVLVKKNSEYLRETGPQTKFYRLHETGPRIWNFNGQLEDVYDPHLKTFRTTFYSLSQLIIFVNMNKKLP